MEDFNRVKVVPDETGYRGGVEVNTGTLIIPEKIQGWPAAKKDFFLEHEAAHLDGIKNEQRADARAWQQYSASGDPAKPFAPIRALDYIFKDYHNPEQRSRYRAQKRRSAEYVLNNQDSYSKEEIKKAKQMLNYAGDKDTEVRNAAGVLGILSSLRGGGQRPAPQPDRSQQQQEGGDDTLLYVGIGAGVLVIMLTVIVATQT
jgi:hypothetical protein